MAVVVAVRPVQHRSRPAENGNHRCSGDFLAYDVDINHYAEVANGAEVQTIPIAAHIDFTQYTDLSELFNVLTVPAGRYTQVVLNLDYTDADIQIEGNDGGEITLLLKPKMVQRRAMSHCSCNSR